MVFAGSTYCTHLQDEGAIASTMKMTFLVAGHVDSMRWNIDSTTLIILVRDLFGVDIRCDTGGQHIALGKVKIRPSPQIVLDGADSEAINRALGTYIKSGVSSMNQPITNAVSAFRMPTELSSPRRSTREEEVRTLSQSCPHYH